MRWLGLAFRLSVHSLITLMVATTSLRAQTPSRAAEIDQARQEKSRRLRPETVGRVEDFLRSFKDQKYLERITAGYNGFRAKLGNMVTGGGFAAGPEYFREDLFSGRLHARGAAQVSSRGYLKLDTQWTLPNLAGGRVFADFQGAHRNYSGINYYGPGPDSSKNGRSNYRLEETSADGLLGLQPVRHLKFGGSLGYVWVNTGPGKDRRFISADRSYSPLVAPGIDHQTDFRRYGVFAQLDFRDNPAGPRQGSNLIAQYTWFDDRKLQRYDFRRLEVDLQHYQSFFNKTGVIAVRGRTVLTDTSAGRQVPFYLQPVLGGSDDLRGFRPFRFSGRNMLALNGEYRWEVFTALDAAVFVDGGKVFERRGEFNFRDLEGSAGFGLRVNAANRTFLRVDVGFSHEGFQVWIKFNDVFVQRPYGTAAAQPVY